MRRDPQAEASESAMEESRIFIVDDDPRNVRLLERALELAGFGRVSGITDPRQVASLCRETPPDLVILDLHMPGYDGFALLRTLAAGPLHEGYLPVLVLTADATERSRRRALAAGAHDFLAKPVSITEAVLRIRNLLATRALYLRLEKQNERLADLVVARTRELEAARFEVLERLCQAAEFRDDLTGRHTRRVGEGAAALAKLFGLPDGEIDLIRRAAPLHDVGKIAIPDAILLKRGPLTPEEFAVMQRHTLIGARILAGGLSAVMATAESIARSHHERWDGGGYPAGLSEEEIPLAARIVAVVDVFDAVTTPRPYRAAWPIAQALEEIHRGSGVHFDPAVVEAFVRLVDEAKGPV